MLRTFALLGLLAAVPAAAVAQSTPAGAQQAESGKPPQRIRSITLTGNQACPKSSDPDAEIVVCARVGEPYRIPKELRDDKPIPAQNQSWVNRTAVADDAGRRAGGLPDTCSPVGSGGQTGCAKMRAEQYAAEKAEAKRQERLIP
ncbi:hypothetical protein [Sphingomonas sp. TREG-RG-20F-R18-01]|uniref:hypothetical protein n=1 Tax=Sphingomonas sp. TREG-RG-20F-R18-01 TaxID=2914982 RepID=UPI001F57C6BA|nr:hypothetical protein [Sphingomonas sp. TREG-RG-20F-R18-01]